jgi:rare lipoprotein A
VTTDKPEPSLSRLVSLAERVVDPRPWFVLLFVLVLTLGVWSEPAPVDEELDGLGPRLVQIGEPAPRGGGHFKIGQPYEINGQRFVPEEDPHYDRQGVASWYGELFHGRQTSNGEIFDMERLSAAHPTLPLPSYVKVRNLDNGLSAVLRVNDRGPFRKGRVIDLSKRAAEVLGFTRAGTANVRVSYLREADLDGDDRFERDYLSTRGYSQYAGTMGPDGMPEVVIAVAAPGALKHPPLPKRPQRPVVSDSQPVSGAASIDLAASHGLNGTRLAELNSMRGDAEITGAIGSSSLEELDGPMIQAGLFKNLGNAQRAQQMLSGVGPVEIAPIMDRGQTYYRVRVGPFLDVITAATALSDVAGAGYEGAKILLQN